MLTTISPGISASTSSATTIPASNQVIRVQVIITTPYSAGALLTLGRAGSTTLLIGNADTPSFDLTKAAGVYDLEMSVGWGASPLVATALIAGAPAAGVSQIIIQSGSLT